MTKAQAMTDTTIALRPCTPADVGIVMTDEAPQDIRDTITEYLTGFLAPIPDRGFVRCVCGERLTGMFGAFTWGLTHGEGFCGSCRRPARGYQSVRDTQGSELIRFACVLLYRLEGDVVTAASHRPPDAARENP